MATIRHRRATKSQWTAANPVLGAGEIGYEIDTNKLKVGNGLAAWDTLTYFVDEATLNATYARTDAVPTIIISDTAPVDPAVGTIWFGPYVGNEVVEPSSALDSAANLLARWTPNALSATDGSAVSSFAPTAGAWSTPLIAGAGTEPTLEHNVLNGKKVLSFNGIDQFIELDHDNITGPSTIVMVCDLKTSGANGGRALASMTATSYRSIRLSSTPGQGGMLTSGSTPNSIYDDNWSETSGWTIVVASFDSTTSRLYRNQRTVTGTGTTNLVAQADLRLGRGPDASTQYSRIDIADLAIIERAVPDAEVKLIVDELVALYGLTLGA